MCHNWPTNESMSISLKKVALIGSSGGGSATLSSGENIISSIRRHIQLIRHRDVPSTNHDAVDIVFALLVVSKVGLDFSTEDTDVTLWGLPNSHDAKRSSSNLDTIKLFSGNLVETNKIVSVQDNALAEAIESGDIDALITISCDPLGSNQKSIRAAIAMGIPIVGTGGQSISAISTSGGNVIGCSGGSVATTSTSRGICFACSLASYWKLIYTIPRGQTQSRGGLAFLVMKFQSIIGATIPILLATAMANYILTFIINKSLSTGNSDLYRSLVTLQTKLQVMTPTVVTMIACSEYSELNELSLIAGAAAGSFAQVGLLSSIVNGIICGEILLNLLILCAKQSILPTATTIISLGMSAILSGVIATLFQYLFDTGLHQLRLLFLLVVSQSLPIVDDYCIAIAGAILGWLVSWGSENGYYHRLMLPAIALEMTTSQVTSFGILGSFDMACLCLPCAGVCAAVWTLSYMQRFQCVRTTNAINGDKSDNSMLQHSRVGKKGFLSSIFLGDFVEACYPYSINSQQPLVLISVRIASAVAGSLLLLRPIQSSAYIPAFLAWLIVNPGSRGTAAAAFLVAFFVPYTTTLLAYYGPLQSPTSRAGVMKDN